MREYLTDVYKSYNIILDISRCNMIFRRLVYYLLNRNLHNILFIAPMYK